MEDTKDINRIKVVLVEKKTDEQMVSCTVGKRPGYGVEMVYQHFATGIGNVVADCQCSRSRCQGITELLFGRDYSNSTSCKITH